MIKHKQREWLVEGNVQLKDGLMDRSAAATEAHNTSSTGLAIPRSEVTQQNQPEQSAC
jgi:hypothetical protein